MQPCFAAKQKDSSTLKAKKITTNPKDNKIHAKGNVELINNNQIFKAADVTYDQKTKVIEASGQVKIKDAQDNKLFAQEAIVKNDGSYEAEFKNGGIIFDNGSSISSPRIIRKSEKVFIMEKPRYALCPANLNLDQSYEEIAKQTIDKKWQLFSIKSSNLKVDNEKKGIYFKHSLFKIYGVPVFYFPYFKTSRPFDNKTHGFGSPRIVNNSNYGAGLFLPYYFKLGKNHKKKLTLTPGAYQAGNHFLGIQYDNPMAKKGAYRLKGKIVNDNEASENITNPRKQTEKYEGKYKDHRGYGNLAGEYQFSNPWSTYFDGTMVSDDYYLRDYEGTKKEYIMSNAAFDRIDTNSTLTFNTLTFQELLYEYSQDEEPTPQAIPIINYHVHKTNYDKKYSNTIYNLDANNTFIHRTSGLEYKRLTVAPNVENYYFLSGNIFKLKTSLRGDTYYLSENYKTPDDNTYDNSESRAIPQLEVKWTHPLATKTKHANITFEPITTYITSPRSNKLYNDIPNEDSMVPELTYSNIFSDNRYSGYDKIELGNRISYGFKSEIYNKTYGALNLLLAQGYKDEHDKDTNSEIRGFSENVSDWVGKIAYRTKKIFNIHYRFRLDKSNFKSKSDEVSTNFNFEKIRLFSTYTMLQAERLGEERQEQVTYGTDLKFIHNWIITGSTTKDFVNKNRTLVKNLAIKYDGCCVTYKVSLKENRPRNDERERTVDFDLTIKTSLF